MKTSNLRVGVYVDAANLSMNGGYKMRYDVLRHFACRGDAQPIRLNAYLSYDAERAEKDSVYRKGADRFHSCLRDYGYKTIMKEVRWYTDDAGSRFGKANVDLDLAVDALLQSENLDRVVLVTGDGDFIQVVRALQNKGCRVEIIAFDNVSTELRREADLYVSGYLIPDLLPNNGASWGESDGFARGICNQYDEKGFGFLRYLKDLDNELWQTDHREENSPYGSMFFHKSELPNDINPNMLPHRKLIFEFDIATGDKGLKATRLKAFRTWT